MNQTVYPFRLVGETDRGADSYQTGTLIYQFCSTKSGHEYEVHVECYVGHLYCLKFFDLTISQSNGKFNQTTGTYEPRTIFYTIAGIAADVLKRDNQASFLFIGAADSRDSSGWSTRRYRVYCSFMRYLDVEKQFEVVCIDRYSLCILANKQSKVDRASFIGSIINFIEQPI